MTATYAILSSDNVRGIRVELAGNDKHVPAPGDTVQVTTESGIANPEKIRKIVWTNNVDIWLCTITPLANWKQHVEAATVDINAAVTGPQPEAEESVEMPRWKACGAVKAHLRDAIANLEKAIYILEDE